MMPCSPSAASSPVLGVVGIPGAGVPHRQSSSPGACLVIRRIQALNFRCLRYVDVDLDGSFHLLVGPNASGKSTLLDVIGFMSDLVSDGLGAAVERRTRNFQDLAWGRPKKNLGFELAVEFDIPDALRTKLAERAPHRTLPLRGLHSGGSGWAWHPVRKRSPHVEAGFTHTSRRHLGAAEELPFRDNRYRNRFSWMSMGSTIAASWRNPQAVRTRSVWRPSRIRIGPPTPS